jgi:hypothetical protein
LQPVLIGPSSLYTSAHQHSTHKENFSRSCHCRFGRFVFMSQVVACVLSVLWFWLTHIEIESRNDPVIPSEENLKFKTELDIKKIAPVVVCSFVSNQLQIRQEHAPWEPHLAPWKFFACVYLQLVYSTSGRSTFM